MGRSTEQSLSLSEMCVNQSGTVNDALQLMNVNCRGVAFVVDDDYRLLGAVTDGDVRRAMLRGELDLGGAVSSVMNTNPSFLKSGSGAEEAFGALSAGVTSGKTVFPRVDHRGRIQSFSYRENWGLIPIAEPELTGNEAAYVLECIESNWISSTGPFVGRFEEAFGKFTGLTNAIAVSNGTVALTLALQALGLPAGAEVIVPDCTFAATANAVVAAGGRPVLADVEAVTWGLSPDLVAPLVTDATWGVMAVHLYGNPCDVAGLRELCDRRGLVLVEDCAEAIGTTVDGRHVGAFGDAAAFSFFGNKTLTTGEGGMVLFRDAHVAARARVLRDHGMSKERRYWHDVVGYNYRLTNLQAAIGVAQIERATDLVERKKVGAALYRSELRRIPGISPMPESPFGDCSYWLMPIVLGEALSAKRESIMEALAARGVQTRITFPALDGMPAFAALRGATAYPNAEVIASMGLCLPNHPRLTADDILHVVESLSVCIASQT